MLLIGSKALEYYGIEIGRKTRDIDIIASLQEVDTILAYYGSKVVECSDTKKGKLLLIQGFPPIEIELIIENNLAAQLHNYATGLQLDISEFLGLRGLVASPEICLTLKLSHRYLKNSPHFLKTMGDIALLRSLGYSVPTELKSWLRDRETVTYNYSHPNLNQGKSDFFTDNVKYVYLHDSIHEAVKVFDRPAYTYFKPEDSEVLCSKKMFLACPEEIRLAAGYEESVVLAIERSQVPHPQTDNRKSFVIALQKLSTSISSGFFREYVWENYHNIRDMYEQQTNMGKNYMTVFKTGIENGIVKII